MQMGHLLRIKSDIVLYVECFETSKQYRGKLLKNRSKVAWLKATRYYFARSSPSDLICHLSCFPFWISVVLEKKTPQAALEMPSGSPAPSSSSSRSSTPAKVRDKKLKSKKEKGKAKSTEASSQPRNEGTDPTWNYAPPPGAVLLNDSVDAGEFDWDAIHDNKDLELWLIRVPESVGLTKGYEVYRKYFLYQRI